MAEDRRVISGHLWKFGDDISTDHILPSRFMTQVEPNELAANCMTGCVPQFSARIQRGDILAAGENLGYGSSREQAPQALKYAGVSVVIAKSFARIFYRNCFNVGIPAIACPTFVEAATEGDLIEVNLAVGLIYNKTLDRTYEFTKPSEFMLTYIKLGGLIPYLEMQMNKGEGETI